MSSTNPSYQLALKFMALDDTNIILIKNFSEEGDYLIDGGPDSLLDLELEEYDNFEKMEFCCVVDMELEKKK
mgnify:FL=1|tara:strand:+ start:261 stop:476 length:216 start_codon:yes stop_codon:yes gene_type:complete